MPSDFSVNERRSLFLSNLTRPNSRLSSLNLPSYDDDNDDDDDDDDDDASRSHDNSRQLPNNFCARSLKFYFELHTFAWRDTDRPRRATNTNKREGKGMRIRVCRRTGLRAVQLR